MSLIYAQVTFVTVNS